MTPRNPPLEKRFKKGTSGSPRGRPHLAGKDVFEVANAIFELLLRAQYKDRSVLVKLKRIREILNEK